MHHSQRAFEGRRHAMVEEQIRGRGIHSATVLRAMERVERERFLPEHMRDQAYADSPLPIAEGQTISQPFVVGYMIDALGLEGGERVLDVGTGSGYAAAVLAEIAGQVISIERHKSLARNAARLLKELGYNNLQVIEGDGSHGWSAAAPYDAIVVAAGAPVVPPALREQLKIGGRLVLPVGKTETRQKLLRITRESERRYLEEELLDVRFVPLVGTGSWQPGQSGPSVATPSLPRQAPSLPQAMAEEAQAIHDMDQVDLSPLLERIGDSRIVCIGEASHGTAEFYRFRARITRALIESRDFDFVAVEADWPDASRIDYYARHRDAPPATWTAFTRFPSWMWRNEEVRQFVDWLHQYNGRYDSPNERTAFYGLDLYSLFNSIDSVLDYLEDIDPKVARIARERYSCFDRWGDPATYGRAAAFGDERCEREVLDMLADLLDKRLHYARQDGEHFLDALQNARLVANAERYYRSMYHTYSESWNLRDSHMFETLQDLLEHHGPQSRAVIWAHNSHLGDASKTDMKHRGQLNLGQLCREAYGDSAYLIGFGTHSGTVTAASDWGGEMEFKSVRPSLPESWEQVAHVASEHMKAPGFMLGMREASADLRRQLQERKLERAIGVIYRPESERASHYFSARLGQQFDEYIWFDESSAVQPIATHLLKGVPDTYPFGL